MATERSLIKLRFSTEKWAIDSALIRWKTDSKISHVEFENDVDGSTLGSRFSLFPSDSGIRIRPYWANSKQTHVVHATFDGIELAYAWVLKNRLGWGYDVKGILGISTVSDWHSRHGRDCSATVFEGAEIGASIELLKLKDKALWYVTPDDLLNSDLVKIL